MLIRLLIIGLLFLSIGCSKRPAIRPVTISEYWDIQARLNWLEGRAQWDRRELLQMLDSIKILEQEIKCKP